MKLLVALVAVMGVLGLSEGKRRVGAVRENMLESNRPSKVSAQEAKAALLGSTCDDCKAVVKQVASYAESSVDILVAKESLKAFCREVLSGDDLQQCLQFADHLPSVVAQLKPLLENPAKLCQMIYLCGAGENRAARVLFTAFKRQLMKMPLSGRERNALCDDCQLGVEEIKTLWDNKNIEKEVEDGLKSACSYAGQYEDTCKALVDEYWGTIVQYVNDELKDAKAVCSSIGLCATRFVSVAGQDLFPARPSALRVHLPRSSAFYRLAQRLGRTQRAKGGRVGCTLCNLAFSTVQASLLDTDTLQGIASSIEGKVESLLPAAYHDPVQDFLATYLVPVLNLAVRQVTPREACQALGACDAGASLLPEESLERLSVRANGPIVCDSCKLLAEAAVAEVSQPAVQKELSDEILHLCDFVPGAYVDECDSLIRENLPTVFEDLKESLAPNTLCPALNLCPSRRLIGRRPNADGMQDRRRS